MLYSFLPIQARDGTTEGNHMPLSKPIYPCSPPPAPGPRPSIPCTLQHIPQPPSPCPHLPLESEVLFILSPVTSLLHSTSAEDFCLPSLTPPIHSGPTWPCRLCPITPAPAPHTVVSLTGALPVPQPHQAHSSKAEPVIAVQDSHKEARLREVPLGPLWSLARVFHTSYPTCYHSTADCSQSPAVHPQILSL
jgi:hypothetical protein